MGPGKARVNRRPSPSLIASPTAFLTAGAVLVLWPVSRLVGKRFYGS